MLARLLILAGLFAAGASYADTTRPIPFQRSAPAAPGPVFANGANPARPAPRISGTIRAGAIPPDGAKAKAILGGGGDGFGVSFSTLGDPFADGGADFVIGRPWIANANGTGGQVKIYDGEPGALFGAPDSILGFSAFEGFGYSVAGVGDVNGDGFGDLLVGAPYRSTGGHSSTGKAYLFLGGALGYNHVPAWTFETLVDDAYVGFHVAWAGDVNRDGYDDWLVGAPYTTDGEASEGAVYLFYGSGGPLSTVPVWTQTSDHINAYLGYSCAGVGDVNGDGYADIAIGAPGDENPMGKTADEGSVSLFAGAPGVPSHTPVKKWYGQWVSAGLGSAISPVGDVDADGYADFIAGAPFYTDTQTNQGIANVYFGGPSFPLLATPVMVKQSIANAHFGYSVGSAGDVNGDGFADFMVGAPDTPQGTGSGAAYLYFGNEARAFAFPSDEFDGNTLNSAMGVSVGQLGDVNGDGRTDYAAGEPNSVGAGLMYYRGGQAIPYSVDLRLAGQGYYESTYLGYTATTADMDGDGFDDLIAASPIGGQEGDNRGYISYWRGGPKPFPAAGAPPLSGATPDWTYTGTQPLGLIGFSLANAGDVNGDGYEDLLSGGYNWANGEAAEGHAILFYGSPSGPGALPNWEVESNEAGSESGLSVAGGGDLDGDGFDDIAIAAPYAAGGGSGRGVVRIYKGAALGPAHLPWVTLSGAQDDANFGISCAIVGDIDRDGYDDLVVGAPFYSEGETGEGRILVYRGSATGVHAPASQEIQINVANAQFGQLVTRIGDVNGDGYADVAVGAPNYANGVSNQGKLNIYYGSPAGLVTPAGWTLDGGQVDLHLGANGVSGCGDYDGDGYNDVFVGQPNFDGASGIDVGRLQIYQGGPGGLSTIPLIDLDGGNPFYYLGYTGGGMADFNGDGQSDFWFSAPGYTLVSASEGAMGVSYGNLYGLNEFNPDRAGSAWRTDLLSPIGVGLRSKATNAFALRGTGRSPAGRTKMRIEYEVKPQATPFNFLGRGFGAWQSGASVVPGHGTTAALTANVTGLGTNSRYHWRARYRSSSPLFPWTPWFGSERNGSTERMLVTGGYPGIVAADPVQAGTLALVSPSPNPSFGTVSLGFDLPRAGDASLVLYGVDGRRVRTLFAGRADAGRTTLTWDGKDSAGRAMPAGAYFARVTFAGEEKVGKIVRVR